MTRTRFGLCSAAVLIVAPTALGQECITTVWAEVVPPGPGGPGAGYVDGQNIITGQACFPICSPGLNWEAWEGDASFGGSTAEDDFGSSPGGGPGDLSIHIWGNRPLGIDDLVHTYHDLNLTSGTWLYSTDLYVPSGTTGEAYFILLNQYANDGSTSSENWSTQIHIDGDDGNLESDFDGGTVPLTFDAWRSLQTIISFADDLQTIRYDGQVINLPGKTWTGGVSGAGILTLAATDLYGNNADPVYFDNLFLCSIPPEGACCFRSDPCVDGIIRADCEALQGDAIFQGIGSACGACPFYGADGWEIEILTTPFIWNGDTCNDFPGIPFNEDCEFFPQDCSECELSDSQDQAWTFQIPWAATWTFSTCGAADFDTVLFAGSDYCLENVGNNDDCTRIVGEDDSELSLALAPLGDGNPFEAFITLEGFDAGDCGTYTLSVGAPCPPIPGVGDVDEENQGPCFDEDTDPENLGCNADPNDPLSIATFTDIQCGDTFNGTVGNFVFGGGGRRDLDWFRLNVDATTTITLDAVGNYPQVVLFLADLNANPGSGEDECTDAGNLLVTDTTPSCTETDGSRAAAQVSLNVGPGRYAPIVSTAFVDPALPVELGGVPCGSPYQLTVTCGDVVACDPTRGDNNGDDCVSFQDILTILGNWGATGDPGILGDSNCDGVVDFQDILLVLATFISQACP